MLAKKKKKRVETKKQGAVLTVKKVCPLGINERQRRSQINCTVRASCPTRIKTAMRLLISAKSLLLPSELDMVDAIMVTFCHCKLSVREKST